jgi:hypothetical protein
MAAGGSITDPADPNLQQVGSAPTSGATSDQQIELMKQHYRTATGGDLVVALREAEKHPERRDAILDELRRMLRGEK